MAHALTEDDDFPASVSVPDGGDARTAASVEAPFQAVADRTRWLRNRVGAYARFRVETAGGGVASGSKLTLATPNVLAALNSGEYSLASNEITVSKAGIYLVCAVLRMSCSSSSTNLTVDAYISAGTSPDIWKSNQLTVAGWRKEDGDAVFASTSGLIQITDPETEKFSIVSGVSNVIIADDLEESHRCLSILRVA